MNMPLTTGQIAHADTVRELSNADRRAMDAIAADIEKVRAPAIDAAACDAAGVNEVAAADEGRTYPMDEWLNARAYVRAYFGREPSNAEAEMFMQGRKARFAGNRSDSYPSNLLTPEQAEEYRLMQNRVSGNRLDTLGHNTPLVKGGQGRNGLDLKESASWFFVLLAACVVGYCLYHWYHWPIGGGM